MSKQRPDATKLANELHGASAFFKSSSPPSTPPPFPVTKQEPVQQNQTNSGDGANRIPIQNDLSDVVTSRRHDAATSPSPAGAAGFDINRPTTSRDSLRLSPDETRALDALRATLKWDYDLTVSKNDICRVALHWLLEDAAAKGERSQSVLRLKRKSSR